MTYKPRFTGFSEHPKLEGSHAFLSPSQPAWIRYTPERLIERLETAEAAAKGTRLHETASRCIQDRIHLDPNGDYPIMAAYVNDCIDFGMQSELTLFYSLYCYGHTDAIGFDPENLFLRIFDLKTGVTQVNFDQLYVYAALFCLEYNFAPFEIQGELRIYQEGVEVKWVNIDRLYLAQVYDAIRESVATIEERRKGDLI